MHTIKLDINDNNLETVLTILKNLKAGLISKLEVDSITNKIILEKDSGTHDTSGKYASPSAYKEKLKRAKKN